MLSFGQPSKLKTIILWHHIISWGLFHFKEEKASKIHMQGRPLGLKSGGAERDFETFTEHRLIKKWLSGYFETSLRLY